MNILQWFMTKFPEYVKKMQECSYHYNASVNSHHLEGDVWSHTIMTYKIAHDINASNIIKYAALLHDIGRIYVRSEDRNKKRVFFGDYEGVSCYVALDILKETNLSEIEKSQILKIISYHYRIIDYIKFNEPSFEVIQEEFTFEEEILKDLATYVKCDLNGRIIEYSRQHLYSNNKIDLFIEKLKCIEPKSKAISTKSNTAYILVGPPNAGKSQWVESNESEAYVISRDEAILEIGKKYGKVTYDEALKYMYDNKHIKKEVDLLNNSNKEHAKNVLSSDIIFDNLSLKKETRSQWINLVGKTHKVKVILFLTPYSVLIERNTKRKDAIGKTISRKTIHKKLKNFKFPLIYEGIDEIEYVFS
jgi:predicted kinase